MLFGLKLSACALRRPPGEADSAILGGIGVNAKCSKLRRFPLSWVSFLGGSPGMNIHPQPPALNLTASERLKRPRHAVVRTNLRLLTMGAVCRVYIGVEIPLFECGIGRSKDS